MQTPISSVAVAVALQPMGEATGEGKRFTGQKRLRLDGDNNHTAEVEDPTATTADATTTTADATTTNADATTTTAAEFFTAIAARRAAYTAAGNAAKTAAATAAAATANGAAPAAAAAAAAAAFTAATTATTTAAAAPAAAAPAAAAPVAVPAAAARSVGGDSTIMPAVMAGGDPAGILALLTSPGAPYLTQAAGPCTTPPFGSPQAPVLGMIRVGFQ